MRDPTVTVCMIVKDEEATIANALASAATITDDIVVADTGSNDDTVAIVKGFTRQLFRVAWRDDFAAARNDAMQYVKGDWVLWLDADEEVEMTDADRWRASLASKAAAPMDAVMVELLNYYGPKVDENNVYMYRSFRLVRRAARLRYKQAIHEHLDVIPGRHRLGDQPIPGLRIRHYGYLDSFVQNKRKHDRNVRLLEKERTMPDYDPWIDYHVASEHYRQGNYRQAFCHLNVALRRFLDRGQLPPALAYRLKYEILLRTDSLGNALPGLERALMLYPDYVDLHYCKGLIQYRQGRFSDAVRTFQHCLALGETGPYLTLKGTGSFLAEHMIGLAWEAVGQLDQALRQYERLVGTYPRYEPTRERLRALRRQKEAR